MGKLEETFIHGELLWNPYDRMYFFAVLRLDCIFTWIQRREGLNKTRTFSHWKCRLNVCVQACQGGIRWWNAKIGEESGCTDAWQAGYYSNEDGCVYHELCISFQSSFPRPCALSILFWDAGFWICWTGTSSWRLWQPTFSGWLWACVISFQHHPPTTTQSHPMNRASCSFGKVMGCGIWVRWEKDNSMIPFFLKTKPYPSIYSTFELFYFCCFSLPCRKGACHRNSIFRLPSFMPPCAHLSICPSISHPLNARFPPQVIAPPED